METTSFAVRIYALGFLMDRAGGQDSSGGWYLEDGTPQLHLSTASNGFSSVSKP